MSVNIAPEFSDESYSEYEPPQKKVHKPKSMPKLSTNKKMMIIVAVVIVLLVLLFLHLYRQRVKKQTNDKRDNMTSSKSEQHAAAPPPTPPQQPVSKPQPPPTPAPTQQIHVHEQIVMTADDHELNKFANSSTPPQVEEIDSNESGSTSEE